MGVRVQFLQTEGAGAGQFLKQFWRNRTLSPISSQSTVLAMSYIGNCTLTPVTPTPVAPVSDPGFGGQRDERKASANSPGVRPAIHPNAPPSPVLGLPRIFGFWPAGQAAKRGQRYVPDPLFDLSRSRRRHLRRSVGARGIEGGSAQPVTKERATVTRPDNDLARSRTLSIPRPIACIGA